MTAHLLFFSSEYGGHLEIEEGHFVISFFMISTVFITFSFS